MSSESENGAAAGQDPEAGREPATGDEAGTRPRADHTRDFERGFLVGVLIGEGHFGGDGKQPQVTLRMHTDHENLFRWIQDRFPGGKLYGPYHHAGRSYYQWMARGSFLREELVPLLDRSLVPELDEKQYRRYREMKETYGL